MVGQNANHRDDPLRDTDSAALMLAAVAGVVVLFQGPGEWDHLSLMAGGIFLLVLTAFHRPVGDTVTPRHWLLRFSFGVVIGLAVALMTTWPMQEWVVRPHVTLAKHETVADRTTVVVAWAVLLPISLLVAICEPALAKWLDKPHHWRIGRTPVRRRPR
jgi:hypothetical protein